MLSEPCRKRYREIKDEWCGVPEVFDRPDVLEERHRIDVDCRRTDRTHPLFCMVYEDTLADRETSQAHRRLSTISPHLSDIGAQSPSNEHIDKMACILLTYNFYNKELGKLCAIFDAAALHVRCFAGYVQGMSDLCAPLYVVMGADEELTFWCFVEVMNRMVSWLYVVGDAGPSPRFIGPKLPQGSKRYEETTLHLTRVDMCNGPGTLSTLW